MIELWVATGALWMATGMLWLAAGRMVPEYRRFDYAMAMLAFALSCFYFAVATF